MYINLIYSSAETHVASHYIILQLTKLRVYWSTDKVLLVEQLSLPIDTANVIMQHTNLVPIKSNYASSPAAHILDRLGFLAPKTFLFKFLSFLLVKQGFLVN